MRGREREIDQIQKWKKKMIENIPKKKLPILHFGIANSLCNLSCDCNFSVIISPRRTLCLFFFFFHRYRKKYFKNGNKLMHKKKKRKKRADD